MSQILTGIIGAMPPEVEELRTAMQGAEKVRIAGMEFCVGELMGKPAAVVQCGIGKVNAGVCAQLLISRFGAGRILNTGVAGSLDARINIGDLVVSTDAVQHDYDVSVIGFAKGEIPYTRLYSFPADEELRRLAVKTATETAPQIQVFEGRVCSGDQFIASREQKEKILGDFGGLCCEMEGGAIAQVCYLNQVPWVIIRAISDKADQSEEMSYEQFQDSAARRCSRIVQQMMRVLP